MAEQAVKHHMQISTADTHTALFIELYEELKEEHRLMTEQARVPQAALEEACEDGSL